MARLTHEQVAAHMERMRSFYEDPQIWSDEADPGLEDDLQGKCIRWCKEHGYPVWHDWSRKRNPAGWPDLIIFMPDKRVKLIELKSAKGKLRKEQRELKLQLNWLGHEVHVVKSYKRFLEVVKGEGG